MELLPQMKVKRMNLCWENEFQFLHPWFGYTVLRRFCQQCSVQLHSSGWQPLLVHLKRCHFVVEPWKAALLC